MSELKPCPACGKPVELEGGQSWHDKHCFLIKCYECGCSRVSDTEKDECVRRWNALPRPLRWTKEPPTAPGFYWNHSKKYKTKEVVHVFEQYGKLYMFFHGNEVEKELSPDDEWAGPIQEPKE